MLLFYRQLYVLHVRVCVCFSCTYLFCLKVFTQPSVEMSNCVDLQRLSPHLQSPYVALRYVLLRFVTFCSFVSWLID